MIAVIGLDIATVTGVAFVAPGMSNHLWVTEVMEEPINQLVRIMSMTKAFEVIYEIKPVFALESLHNFRNAKVTRSLLTRYGYIKYSLIRDGYEVHEVAPREARKTLGVVSKKETFDLFLPRVNMPVFTTNHSDALAVAIHVYTKLVDIPAVELVNRKVYRVEEVQNE